MDLSTPLASVIGDARGRLLEAVVRSDRPRSIREWSRRAGEWVDAEYVEPSWVSTGPIGDLMRGVEREAAAYGIDLSRPPWTMTVAILAALENSGATFEDILCER